jgi:hypothetical protein
MKTIKKESSIIRVSDNEAYDKVRNEGYQYCPKSELKKTQPKKEIKK